MFEKMFSVLDRLATDSGFRTLVDQQPELALASYDLNLEEKQALFSVMSDKEAVLGTRQARGFWSS